MAFSISDYFESKFDVERTPEAIKEAAEAILETEGKFNIGSTAYLDWAETALSYIEDYEDILAGEKGSHAGMTLEEWAEESLDDAYKWITGSAQPTKAKSVYSGYQETMQEITDDLENYLADRANVLDFSDTTLTDEEKAAAEERAAELDAEISDLAEIGELLGINIEDIGLTKTESGYIPTSEVSTIDTETTETSGSLGRTGETLSIKQNEETGLYEVIGDSTGEVYGSSENLAEALAIQQQTQGGSTPSITGQPTVYATEPTTEEEQAAVASGEATVATEEQLEDITVRTDVGDYIPNREELDRLVSLGLTEDDIIREMGEDGVEKIYFKPGVSEQTLIDRQASSTTLPDNIDTEGLTAEDIADLEDIYSYSQGDLSLITDPTITSETVSDATVEDFLKTAQEELNPYYQQLFQRTGEEYIRGMEYLAQQREIELQTEQANALAEQEALAESAAESGTTFSGIRQEAESLLAEEQELAATSSRLAYEYDIESTGREAEDVLGSEYLGTLELPTLEGETVFELAGDVKGSLEAEQETAEQVRAAELEEEAKLAEIAASDEEGVATEEIATLT